MMIRSGWDNGEHICSHFITVMDWRGSHREPESEVKWYGK